MALPYNQKSSYFLFHFLLSLSVSTLRVAIFGHRIVLAAHRKLLKMETSFIIFFRGLSKKKKQPKLFSSCRLYPCVFSSFFFHLSVSIIILSLIIIRCSVWFTASAPIWYRSLPYLLFMRVYDVNLPRMYCPQKTYYTNVNLEIFQPFSSLITLWKKTWCKKKKATIE